MQLPHAAEIRALRTALAAGGRARDALNQLEPMLAAVAMGGAQEEAFGLLEQLRGDWPEVALDGELFEALSAARAALQRLVGLADSAGRELHDLTHRQWDALAAPEFAQVRAEIAELVSRRAALHASVGPLQSAAASLTPLGVALNGQLAEVWQDLEADDGRLLVRAQARLGAIRTHLGLASERTHLSLAVPDAPVDGDRPSLERAAEQAGVALQGLSDALATLSGRRDALLAELAEVDARIAERTG